MLLKRKSLIALSLSIVLLDQLSKLSISHLLKGKASIPLIPQLINMRMVRNTGAAFSLFSDSGQMLGFLSLCVSIGLITWMWRSKPLPILRGLGFSFLLGGCVGNGLDRWRLGYVNDFIELLPVNFPIFNCADIAINVAVICFLIESMSKQNKKNVA